MKIRFLTALVLAAGALAGCSDDSPTFVDTEPQAYVRFVNASPDSPLIVFRFVDRVENMFNADRINFRGTSGMYIPVNAGTRQLRVFPTSGSAPGLPIDSAQIILLDTTVTLAPQTYYTIVQTGRLLPRRGQAGNTARVTVFTDTLPAAANLGANDVLVRAYHVAEGVGAVNVDVARALGTTTIGATATTPAISFNQRSPYLTLTRIGTPGTITTANDTLFRFTVRPAGTGTTALFSASPNVPGQAFTAASASGPALDPVAGVRQGRSVMSLFVFPAAVAGTAAASVSGAATPGVTLVPDQMPPRP